MVATQMGTRAQLSGVQAARAVAALLVVGYHLDGLSDRFWQARFAAGMFSGGFAGVDLFFVLSGFIIVYIHGKDVGTRRRDRLLTYAWRRFVRIYPFYALVSLVILATILAGFGDAAKRDAGVIIRSFLLLPQRAGEAPVVTVGWSLSYEALFYIIFALMIVLPRWAARLLFAGWMASTLVMTLDILIRGKGIFLSSSVLTFVLHPKNLEFGAGCLVGWAALAGRIPRPGLLFAAGIAGFTLTLANENLAWVEPWFGVRLPGYGLSSMALVAGIVGLDRQGHLVAPRALAYLGDASYSIYLVHGIALNLFFPIATRLGIQRHVGIVPAQLLAFAIAVAASVLVYRFVELRLLDRLRRLEKIRASALSESRRPAPPSLRRARS